MPLLILGFDVAVIYFVSRGEYRIRNVGTTCVLMGLAIGTIAAALIGWLWQFNWLGTVAAKVPPDVMLPILLYPITIPVIIAGVEGTSALIASPANEPMANLWLALLAFFDVVFITLSLWVFEPLMTE